MCETDIEGSWYIVCTQYSNNVFCRFNSRQVHTVQLPTNRVGIPRDQMQRTAWFWYVVDIQRLPGRVFYGTVVVEGCAQYRGTIRHG